MKDEFLSHEFFMEKAYSQALLAYGLGEVPIGAVLIDNNYNIIAEDFNQTITLKDPTAHAEILAIKKGAEIFKNHRLVDTTLYVTMEPCMMCLGAIVQARVDKLVYACGDTRVGVISRENYHLNKHINHNLNVTSGIMDSKCSELLKKFFLERRNKK